MRYILAIVLFFFVGCASINTESASARLTVQYAVLKYIKEDTQKAERVVIHVDRAIALVEGNEVISVSDIVTKIRASINWKRLDPADLLLLDALLLQLEDSLKKRIGDGRINPEGRVELITVLGWIKNAALMAN